MLYLIAVEKMYPNQNFISKNSKRQIPLRIFSALIESFEGKYLHAKLHKQTNNTYHAR